MAKIYDIDYFDKINQALYKQAKNLDQDMILYHVNHTKKPKLYFTASRSYFFTFKIQFYVVLLQIVYK